MSASLAASQHNRHRFDLANSFRYLYMHDMHAHDAHCGHDHDHLHSHRHDPADVLRMAEETCLKSGARLTSQRRAVLEALVESTKPLGAYDLIDLMRAKTGRGPAPIAIYRALDFLREQGLIHRLETLNAFIACPHQHAHEEPVAFLICECCRSVEEATAEPLVAALQHVAVDRGFVPRRQVLELGGLCQACQGK